MNIANQLIRKSILALLILTGGCSDAPQQGDWQTNGKTMGTRYSVQLARCRSVDCTDRLAERIDTRLARLDAQYSHYRDDSDVSRFNRHRSLEWFPASHEFVEIVQLAHQISVASEGAFDITLGKAVEAWGFGASDPQLPPSNSGISLALTHSGYEKLEFRMSPAGLRKRDPELSLDMSAIVKGYAADQIAYLLEFEGLDNYVIDIGGELRVSGTRSDGQLWRVGVESPSETLALNYLLTPRDNAVATSGDYRNFYFSAGQRIAHTIDPANATPVSHPLSSVTVINPLGAHADAWATALMVMGPEKGYDLAEAQNIPALFVTRSGSGFTTRKTQAIEPYLLSP